MGTPTTADRPTRLGEGPATWYNREITHDPHWLVAG